MDSAARHVRRTTPHDQLPEYLSPEEFGAYLALSRNTTYDLLRRGEVPHLRFGRAIRIPKTALLMEQGRPGVISRPSAVR
jgi:excisionase family DNA binding protein